MSSKTSRRLAKGEQEPMLPAAGWGSAKLLLKSLYVPNSFLITFLSTRQNCVSLKTYVCIHSEDRIKKWNYIENVR